MLNAFIVSLLYLMTVLISYLFFRQAYKLEGNDAQHNPHGLAIVSMLIPVCNIIISFVFMIVIYVSKCKYKFDYKKFFRLK